MSKTLDRFHVKIAQEQPKPEGMLRVGDVVRFYEPSVKPYDAPYQMGQVTELALMVEQGQVEGGQTVQEANWALVVENWITAVLDTRAGSRWAYGWQLLPSGAGDQEPQEGAEQ